MYDYMLFPERIIDCFDIYYSVINVGMMFYSLDSYIDLLMKKNYLEQFLEEVFQVSFHNILVKSPHQMTQIVYC